MKRLDLKKRRLGLFKTKVAGFTLVELMIVVAIIGILVAIGIPQFLRFSQKTKRAEAVITLRAVYIAQGSYNASENEYANGNTAAINKKLGLESLQNELRYYKYPNGFNYYIVQENVNNRNIAFVAELQGELDQDGFNSPDWLFIRSENYDSSCSAFPDCSSLYYDESNFAKPVGVPVILYDDIFNQWFI